MILDRKRRTSKSQASEPRVGQPFNPYKLFTGIFIPEALVRYRGLSCGAKVACGRLARYAGENGECWPAIPTLAGEMGIGSTQTRTYVHELRDQRFMAIEPRPGTSGVYTFLWHEAFAGEVGNQRKAPPLRKTGGVVHQKTVGEPLQKTGPPPLRKTEDEESQVKENHHQESQIEESQSCASISTLISEGTKISKPTLSRPVDDDEKLREAPAYGSPWEELHVNYRTASKGIQMSYQDERWLKEEMELRGITAQALVDLVRTNPLSGFNKPMAGLKWLVKKFRIKTRSGPELQTAGTAPGFSQRTENSRCEKCGNTGLVLERIEGQRPRATDQYCDCRMGKEVEAVERRKRMAALLDGQRPWSPGGAPSETGDRHVAN